jgi:hypothetical protein
MDAMVEILCKDDQESEGTKRKMCSIFKRTLWDKESASDRDSLVNIQSTEAHSSLVLMNRGYS